MDVSAFTFNTKPDPEKDFVARVPAGLKSRDALFDALSHGLHFPEPFGRNWNALFDCLRDFSWTASRRVFIVHDDVPALGPDDIAEYMSVLGDAVRGWKFGEVHELVVVFPEEYRTDLARVGILDSE